MRLLMTQHSQDLLQESLTPFDVILKCEPRSNLEFAQGETDGTELNY